MSVLLLIGLIVLKVSIILALFIVFISNITLKSINSE